MSIKIAAYDFEGPHNSANALYDKPGVYVILDFRNGKYFPIDVGGSDTAKSRVGNHDRTNCWKRNSQGHLVVAVFYTKDWETLEKLIRNQFAFPCGDR